MCVCVRACVCVHVCVCVVRVHVCIQVLFTFLHDYSILDQLQCTNMTPMKAYIPGTHTHHKCAHTCTMYMLQGILMIAVLK